MKGQSTKAVQWLVMCILCLALGLGAAINCKGRADLPPTEGGSTPTEGITGVPDGNTPVDTPSNTEGGGGTLPANSPCDPLSDMCAVGLKCCGTTTPDAGTSQLCVTAQAGQCPP